MKTPIETIRKAAATRGGLAKAADGQIRRWWLSLDNLTRKELAEKVASRKSCLPPAGRQARVANPTEDNEKPKPETT